jgi:hypothetical protein
LGAQLLLSLLLLLLLLLCKAMLKQQADNVCTGLKEVVPGCCVCWHPVVQQ